MTNNPPSVKIPPNSQEAEQAILGGFFVNPATIPQVREIIGPEDMYREAHQHIFQAFCELHDQHISPDLVTVSDWLTKKGLLEIAGGQEYIVSLADVVSTSAGWKHWAEIVRDLAVRRKLIMLCASTAEACFQGWGETDEILSEHKNSVRALDKTIVNHFDNRKLYTGLHESLYNTEVSPGLLTGIDNIDMEFFLDPGCTNVVAAESGTGKSAFCLQVTDYVARKYGPALYFSMESTSQKLGIRQIARYSKIALTRLNKKNIEHTQEESLNRALDDLIGSQLFLIDDMRYSVVEKAISLCESTALKMDLKLAVFDFIQLFESFKKSQNRHLEISGIARQFNALAKNLNIPVIYVSQLKEVEGVNKKPTLQRLKESGDIRNHADNILFLYAPDPSTSVYDILCFLAKGKDQEKFSTWLKFNGHYQEFKDGQEPEEYRNKYHSGGFDG